MTKNTKKPKFICPICNKLWKSGQDSIQCTICEKWIHFRCSLLNLNEFSEFSDSALSKPWFCVKCVGSFMPFTCLNDNQLFIETNFMASEPSEDLQLFPDFNFQEFTESCHNALTYFNNSDTVFTDNFNQIDSKYYDLNEFNLIKPKANSSIGFLHTNLASLYKHHSDLILVLSLFKYDFHIIAITEHKIKEDYPIQNIEIPHIMNLFMILLPPRMVVQDFS